MSQQTNRPTHATRVIPLRAGDAVGRPLTETAYVTPRSPDGIRASELRAADRRVQRETMAFWFLSNFRPATETYFGFAEQVPTIESGTLDISTVGGVPLGPPARIGGFDQGTWFTGGRAPDLLRSEFSELVPAEALADASSVFGGLWEQIPPRVSPSQSATREELHALLDGALQASETLLRALAPEHGGMGHNDPTGGPLSRDEIAVTLQAVVDMRLAMPLSDTDPSVLDVAWSGISGVFEKFGRWAQEQLGVFFDNFTPAAGKAIGEAAPTIVAGVLLWHAGMSVHEILAMLVARGALKATGLRMKD